ncbi:hypothetical protein MBLNU459_g0577t1 [Dothideomycetes sp. NU459]
MTKPPPYQTWDRIHFHMRTKVCVAAFARDKHASRTTGQAADDATFDASGAAIAPASLIDMAPPRRRLSPPSRREGPNSCKSDSKQKVGSGEDDKRRLLEELFPEEAERRIHDDKSRREREVPRLPLHVPATAPSDLRPRKSDELDSDFGNSSAKKFYALLRNSEREKGDRISVLVLRNASKNLVDDDFRRLIPQGKHIEGWNLERGDIIKIIPGRDSVTLERENYYFILFKSMSSAFTYQTHVTRLHSLAQSNVPSSLVSPIPPPPGYSVGGQDLHALLQSYALVPPSQSLHLRQLKRPFTSSVAQIVSNQGYPAIVNRPNRAPVEVVLRLEGPQLAVPHIRSAIYNAAKSRGLPWTGEQKALDVFKWEPHGRRVSPMGRQRLEEHAETFEKDAEGKDKEPQRAMREALPCYTLGFNNESDAQTFVRYWHRRPMHLEDFVFEDSDTPPVVNAEILW